MPNVEAQKIEAFGEVHDARLFLREGQTPFLQPFHQDFLHLFGVFPALTEADKIIGIPHDRTFSDELASVVVFDPKSLFHPVQRDICQ